MCPKYSVKINSDAKHDGEINDFDGINDPYPSHNIMDAAINADGERLEHKEEINDEQRRIRHYCTQSFTRLLICSLIHLLTRSSTYILTYSLTHLLTHLLTTRQVQVNSMYECPCTLTHDTEVSLRDYMRLPVDQYVCIKMPLDATLTRVENSKVENRFDLVVPPGTHSPT